MAKTPPNGYQFTASRYYKKDEHTFHCASAEVEGRCPIAEVPPIHMAIELWDMFLTLAEECETEWITMLLGNFDPASNKYNVTGYYFPPQTATGSSVDVPTCVQPKAGVVGALHSHVRMNVFFSHTDKEHSNWPFEIVVNARGEYAAMARFQLKCGAWSKQEAKVFVEGERRVEGWEELQRAFAMGAKLAKGKVAEEDEGEDEYDSKITASYGIATPGIRGRMEGDVGYRGRRGRRGMDKDGLESLDKGEAEVVESKCPECKGIGLTEVPAIGVAVGEESLEICGKCNGWGRLVDGKAISAERPRDYMTAGI